MLNPTFAIKTKTGSLTRLFRCRPSFPFQTTESSLTLKIEIYIHWPPQKKGRKKEKNVLPSADDPSYIKTKTKQQHTYTHKKKRKKERKKKKKPDSWESTNFCQIGCVLRKKKWKMHPKFGTYGAFESACGLVEQCRTLLC